MLKLLSGMEEKSNSCLLPTILLAKRLQKVTTNNLTIFYKLAAKKVCSPDSSEVRELVSEYGFLMKQLSQIKKEHGLMVAQAQYYRNEKIKPMIDEKYGNGTAEFFAQAFEAFYKDK